MLKYKFFIKFRKFTALRNKHDASVPAIWVQHKIFTLGKFQEIKKYAQLLLKQIFELLGIYIYLMPRWDIIQSIGKLFVSHLEKLPKFMPVKFTSHYSRMIFLVAQYKESCKIWDPYSGVVKIQVYWNAAPCRLVQYFHGNCL
jgi:hypothetical protein